MLRLELDYVDFNEEPVKGVFYFNLTEAELIEMEVSGEGGSFSDYMKRIVESDNPALLISEFKKLILAGYGEKSQDGRHFIKTDELREEFVQSAAYSTLFMKMATDEKYAIDFVRGMLPKKLAPSLDDALVVPAKTPPNPTSTNPTGTNS